MRKRPPKAAPAPSPPVHGAIKKGVYQIYVDGASRGNPGKAGAGAAIKDAEGNVVRKLKSYLGVMTNNMAEYSAMIMALKAARDMGIKDIRIHADSELMVKQLNGVYRVKSHDLMPLFLEATHLLGAFDEYKIAHIYREGNALADGLANEAIDQRG
ncbi:MAG: ribonuclease HI family protein [Deltaproteobacteria bacterium]|nr:ribonuclease HI family protein [Deltaproteobacteria bacterium]